MTIQGKIKKICKLVNKGGLGTAKIRQGKHSFRIDFSQILKFSFQSLDLSKKYIITKAISFNYLDSDFSDARKGFSIFLFDGTLPWYENSKINSGLPKKVASRFLDELYQQLLRPCYGKDPNSNQKFKSFSEYENSFAWVDNI